MAAESVTVVVPQDRSPLEQYAFDELTAHLTDVYGVEPGTIDAGASEVTALQGNVIHFGRLDTSTALRALADGGYFTPNTDEQGFALRVALGDARPGHWRAVLCGADPMGLLYAVRDFCHYYLYRENGEVVVREADISTAPVIKTRQLSESGCNLFSATNPEADFMYYVHLNAFSSDVVFNKQHFVDWLSEWKVNQVTLIWCNFEAYEQAYKDFIAYARTRGIKVFAFYVPFRPGHEGPPPSVTDVPKGDDGGSNSDCPRDPVARQWYRERLVELAQMDPPLDGVVIESPYHDGVACQCDECRVEAYPEDQLLAEMYTALREARPDLPIVRCIKHNITEPAVGEALAENLKALAGPGDWYMNTYPDQESRRRWHALGPQFSTYLRPYREILKGEDPAREVADLFAHFGDAAKAGVQAHGFCYRFYGGRMGSYKVSEDEALRAAYSERKGAFSMALVAEAAFDPDLGRNERTFRIRRMAALTIPDYPRGDPMAPFQTDIAHHFPYTKEALQPHVVDPASHPTPSKLLRTQYSIQEPGFLLAQVCADVDNDGAREVVYASRGTGYTHLLRAADGSAKWSKKIPGDHQSIMAYDLDSDGALEIVYTTSGPGRAYVLEGGTGEIRHTWEAGDWKAGHSPVIIDADGDGTLDGFLGTRGKSLARLNMSDLTTITTRTPWGQCGCHPSAMDVDGDGQWDLFAGSGDDSSAKGVAYRYAPLTLEPVWQFATNDNASSADMVLVDIDGDGKVEVLKSVDSHAKDDAHDAVHAWEADGTHLWTTPGFSGEDSPNVADIDGDGTIEIIGMTFGSEVYCLNSDGSVRWRKDLRPGLDDDAHAYMTPVLCDVNGLPGLEIVAFTNDAYFANANEAQSKANGIIFVLDATGEVLDQYDVGAPRYWGTAFACDGDDDPYLELFASGSGGFDVIETRGSGPDTEHFQRRRTYQRLNVLPWAYEDTYFNYRGIKEQVVNRADSLVLARDGEGYALSGSYTTELFTLPPGMAFKSFSYEAVEPEGTTIHVHILNEQGEVLRKDVVSGKRLALEQSVFLKFVLHTSDTALTPALDSYSLQFETK